jgi:hypothetical protein
VTKEWSAYLLECRGARMAIGGLLLSDDLLRKIASLSEAKKVFATMRDAIDFS